MQFTFCDDTLPQVDLPDGVTRWNADSLEEERRLKNGDGHADRIVQTINVLGKRSKEAQSLNAVLTSAPRLRENRDARLYLLCHGGKGVGILKVGVKKLFVVPPSHAGLVEIDPVCVLDFFVDTATQRRGFGKILFEYMLASERLTAGDVAIDRPSVKFLAFLRKHYGLVDYTPQSNNFVVFHEYFENRQSRRGNGGGHRTSTLCGVNEPQQARTVNAPDRPWGLRSQFGKEVPAPSTHSFPISGITPMMGQRVETTTTSTFGAQRHQSQQYPLYAAGKRTPYELQYERYLRSQHTGQGGTTSLDGVNIPRSSAEVRANEYGPARRTSPTRSGVPYNIINGSMGP
uniref:Alpha-tubulin N-acetyltransferase n=1 Tax=Trypanosoma congolense (strain IL3000) TaxID=1068625 RepID=G0UJT7_TRYCI|nr:unnamed protein product [Trypanosoma congolense IL3000]